jgi:hypothetical protein
VRSSMLGLTALAAPLLSVANAGGIVLPRFSELIGPKELRKPCPITRATGWAWMITIVAALSAGLGLTFDSRYLEFGYAPLIAAALGFWFLSGSTASPAPATTERASAAILALSALYITFNEGVANWQAVLTSTALLAIALRLWLQGARTQTS